MFRGEGQKSQGYEIVEQLLWCSPDYLIAPIGCGTNLAAIVKGIREFYQLGLTDKIPKVIGVQPVGANVVVEAYKRKSRSMKAINNPQTVCSAVAVSYPLDGLKVLNDIYETGGMAVEVTDEETLSAEKELASKESIFAEPSAALPLAALKKLAGKKIFKKDDKIVCVITGNGLKDPVTMLRILPSPPSIEPDMKEVGKYLKMKLYNIQGTVEKDKIEELWNKKPNKNQLVSAVKKQFKIDLPDDYIKNLEKEVKKFFVKSGKMVKSDLQHLIEDVLKMVPDSKKLISIEDFNVSTSKNAKARASVKVKINKNRYITNEAEGVGPVDAIMRAIRNVIKNEKLMKCWLTAYDVKIDQKGTDATVEVSMGLRDDKGNKVIATATSPDVIVASIDAFERGYNVLYNKQIN